MRIIKTGQDLRVLSGSGVLPEAFTEYLGREFRMLEEALGGVELEGEFTLDHCGYIVVLERGDNLRDLSCVGLNRKDGGLLGCWPEYVERVELDGIAVYRIGVLYTNEFMMMFYTEAGMHDAEVEAWLEENCD